MSVIASEDNNSPPEVVRVLFTLQDGFDLLNFTGPLQILTLARHKPSGEEAFDVTFCAASEHVMSAQGAAIQAHMSFKEAHSRLSEFDVLIVPGGNTESIIEAKSEPLPLIEAFVELQQKDTGRERTLFSVSTGSHLLAAAGVLQGLAATTHPDQFITLEKLAQNASAFTSAERTDVMEERYVVNNARFDIDDMEDNPFIVSKEEYLKSRKERRMSVRGRKGSNAFKESNTRRESNARRVTLRLGGLRVITSGAVTGGMDAALYLVCAMCSVESAEEVARQLQYKWAKGVVVDSIDL